MKRDSSLAVVALISVLLGACSPQAESARKHAHAPLDLPPDATTEQLKMKLDTIGGESKIQNLSLDDGAFFDLAFKIGSRLNLWIKNVNSKRSPDEQLWLWTPETTRAIPIDAPKERTNYSVESTKATLNALRSRAPKEMVDVIFGDQEVPSELSIADADFLEWGREFDRAYQTGMRLKMLLPYIDWYKENRNRDVRGYYFLSKMADRQHKLAFFSNLSSAEQAQLITWLSEVCMNSNESLADCKESLRKLVVGGSDLNVFYANYVKEAENTWSSLFNIDTNNMRHDITWTSTNPNVALIPFLKTSIQEVNDYLSVNIQEEWKWAGWQLQLSFQDSGSNIPFVVFQSGATPHVNGLGGNQITMDALTNLQGWDSRWTIRHEFGHVLGFPDCYVEFFEEESGDMVNYQLDTSDLMCSRRGKLKERHYLEMKRVYGSD